MKLVRCGPHLGGGVLLASDAYDPSVACFHGVDQRRRDGFRPLPVYPLVGQGRTQAPSRGQGGGRSARAQSRKRSRGSVLITPSGPIQARRAVATPSAT